MRLPCAIVPPLLLLLLAPEEPSAASTLPTDGERAHLLLARATYGARPGDLERLLATGVDAWLRQQLDPERIADEAVEPRLAGYPDLALPTPELLAKYPRPSREERQRLQQARRAREDGSRMETANAPPIGKETMGPRRVVAQLTEARLLRAVHSERQLEEVLVDFWFNHFNVYARKDPVTALLLPSYERDAIRPHVLGKFRDLLLATAQHPAMLRYLDNWINTKPDFDPRSEMMADRPAMAARRGAGRARPREQQRTFGLNENYARELLELHTLGVDGGYGQQDVVEVARCLTGWTVTSSQLLRKRGRARGDGVQSAMDGAFHFSAAAHDGGAKTVLGHTIDRGGVEDGLAVIDLLAAHESTARFVCTKLAARFASDTPSPVLVDEMVATWRATDGDLRAVLQAMFESPTYYSDAARHDKVKTPLELAVSAVRATNGRYLGGGGLARAVMELGMPLYQCQPPTGYEESAAAWLSAGSMLNRIHFVGELLSGHIPGVRIGPLPADVDGWAAQILAPGSGSADDQATLQEALSEFSELAGSGSAQSVAVLMASPAFQKQ